MGNLTGLLNIDNLSIEAQDVNQSNKALNIDNELSLENQGLLRQIENIYKTSSNATNDNNIHKYNKKEIRGC